MVRRKIRRVSDRASGFFQTICPLRFEELEARRLLAADSFTENLGKYCLAVELLNSPFEFSQSSTLKTSPSWAERIGDPVEPLTRGQPSRSVLQWIDGEFHRWSEYDLDEDVDGTSRFFVVLEEPTFSVLSRYEAIDLLIASEQWQTQASELIPGLMEVVDLEDVVHARGLLPIIDDQGHGRIEGYSAEDNQNSSGLLGGGSTRNSTLVGNTQIYPYNTVGYQLQNFGNDWFRCTSFIVSPHTALTNGHCVYNVERGGYADSVRISPGQYQLGGSGSVIRPFGTHHAEQWVTNDNYIAAGSGYTTTHTRHDYAAAFYVGSFVDAGLATYVPLQFNYAPPTNPAETVHPVGYPATMGGGASQSMWDMAGQVVSVEPFRLIYNSQTSGGSSGSPVWSYSSGQPRVIGIHAFRSGSDLAGATRLTSNNQTVIQEWVQWRPSSNDDIGDTLDTAAETGVGPFVGSYSIAAILGDGPHGNRDVDMFSFDASAGSRFRMETSVPTSGAGVDTMLRLFDSQGNQLAMNDNFGGTLYSQIIYDFSAAGTYFVGVSGFPNINYDPQIGGSGVAGNTGGYTFTIEGIQQVGSLMVGVDFGPSGSTSPTNWALYSGGSSGVTLTGLTDEFGVASAVELSIQPSTNISSDSSSPPDSQLPIHLQSLSGIDGNIWSFSPATFLWSGLDPGETYEIYVFAADTFSGGQSVTVSGGSAPLNFEQFYSSNQLLVNSELGTNTRELESYMVVAMASAAGTIEIEVEPLGSSWGLAGLAVRPTDGTIPFAEIRGTLWQDENGDGMIDGEESVLGGRTVYLDRNHNGRHDRGEPTFVSEDDGSFSLLVHAGVHILRQLVPMGWEATSPHTDAWIFDLGDGDLMDDANFGSRPLQFGEIRGYKWLDLNSNGIWDEGELPLEGWVIYLDLNRNGQLDESEPWQVTGPDGSYAFTDLPVGVYSVAEVMQPGWFQTSPGQAMGQSSGSDVEPASANTIDTFSLAGLDSSVYWAMRRANQLFDGNRSKNFNAEQWVVILDARQNQTEKLSDIVVLLGAKSAESIPYLANAYLFQDVAPDSMNSIAERLGDHAAVTAFFPLIAEQPRSRIPNDPLFPNQWHLRNIGQTGGTPGADANLVPAWDEFSGAGVTIAVVDDGLQYTHPDLSARYLAALSWDFNGNDPDPAPGSTNDYHGTAVAGVAAASGNNALGGIGAAPGASLSGIRLIAGPTTDLQRANALIFENQGNHIYNNSWGPWDTGSINAPGNAGPLSLAALAGGVQSGRDGLGSIYVWAGGNGQLEQDNVNYDSYANSRYTIAVGAIDHRGLQSSYSESGAPLIVSAFSSGGGVGVTTSTLTELGSYTSSFGGTSSAAPLVSGVVALMLEANPNLSWRDVQHVLAKSASLNDPGDNDWVLTGAGRMVNHKYGHGAINARAAVDLAQAWHPVSQEVAFQSGTIPVGQPIPDNNPLGVTSTFAVDEVLEVEWVEIVLDATHPGRGQLQVILTSPSGTRSILAERRTTDNGADYNNWLFTSARHWGELSAGDWTLQVSDLQGEDIGTLNGWQINLYGTRGVSGSHLVQLRSGEVKDGINFGNMTPVHVTRQQASVAGLVLDELSNSGTWGGLDPQAITLSASLGEVIQHPGGTWSWSYMPSTKLTDEVVTINASDGQDQWSAQFLISAEVHIVGQWIYYKGSAFAQEGANVQAALSTDSSAARRLLRASDSSQQTTFQNVSNYTRGINGIVFDVAGLTGEALEVSDFQFRVGKTGDPNSWAAAPDPTLIHITPGTETIPARVRIEWEDNAIMNTWLQIVIRANEQTGLNRPEVFYLGHADGEVNGDGPNMRVTNADVLAVRQAVSSVLVSIDDVRDVNKDRRVTNADVLYIRQRVSSAVVLGYITIPPV
ncbi:DVUA0089 family protein [Pirellulaceae bacterium SH449]